MISPYQLELFDSYIKDFKLKSSYALQHFNIYSNTEGSINAQLADQYQQECILLQSLIAELYLIKQRFLEPDAYNPFPNTLS